MEKEILQRLQDIEKRYLRLKWAFNGLVFLILVCLVSFAFDANGEAVHIVALEEGTKGLIIGGANGRLMIGMSDKNGAWFKNKEAFTGIKYFDNEGNLVWEQPMQVKK
ncbi:MAG: hypothetical protein HC913_12385 [Microscillaceae bacterium]|nr:hypothetical protein [Microscillaceae bacterium]